MVQEYLKVKRRGRKSVGLRKIVINDCHGGFGLSEKAYDLLLSLRGQRMDQREVPRDDPFLLQVVTALGEEANGKYAKLKIVEIPEDVKWTIEEYDGQEWVAEAHRTWG